MYLGVLKFFNVRNDKHFESAMELKGILGRRCSYVYLGYRNVMEEVKLDLVIDLQNNYVT